MLETYGSYVDDDCFDIHDYGGDTDDDAEVDTNDDADDGRRGHGVGTWIPSKFLAVVPGSLGIGA